MSTKKANVVHEGRSQRANGLIKALNELNEKAKGQFKYTVAEEFRHAEVPNDSVELLLEDGFEMVDPKEAASLLGRELRGRRKLMRIPYATHLAIAADAIKRAAPHLIKPEQDQGSPFVMRAPEEKTTAISISE